MTMMTSHLTDASSLSSVSSGVSSVSVTVLAPRPVRLPFFRPPAAARQEHDSPSRDRDPSPRCSPLSSEALDEFLSILSPSFFPSPSPGLRTRRPHPFHYDLPFSFLPRSRSRLDTPVLADDASRSPHHSRSPSASEAVATTDLPDQDSLPLRWFSSGVLSSPVSRMHTRNPFLRNSSNQSPAPAIPVSPLSPAAVPLPLPTPDETADVI